MDGCRGVVPQNRMTIRIPFCFLNQTATLSWADIRYAIAHNWIASDVVVDFALYRLALPLIEAQAEELEFLYVKADWRIIDLVEVLACREHFPENILERKWLFIVLSWIYANKATFDAPLQLVEEVYAEFDYPQSISSFVRYMPMTEPDLGSRQKNEERLYQYWQDYLVAEAAHWKTNRNGQERHEN